MIVDIFDIFDILLFDEKKRESCVPTSQDVRQLLEAQLAEVAEFVLSKQKKIWVNQHVKFKFFVFCCHFCISSFILDFFLYQNRTHRTSRSDLTSKEFETQWKLMH